MPSDRPSYLQKDLVELIHLLSSIFFFFIICWAKETASKLYCISSILVSLQGIPPNFSQLLWERAAAAAPCSCWGTLYSLYFLFQGHYIMLYCLSLSLANEHKATASSSLMTAKLSQLRHACHNNFMTFFFFLEEKSQKMILVTGFLMSYSVRSVLKPSKTKWFDMDDPPQTAAVN